ncbi:MAG TPA: hypothetical protein ENI82_03095, partial [Bacteroidetes bacterium]|nr:hypothetical protein [Bacteroidota bacterium]
MKYSIKQLITIVILFIFFQSGIAQFISGFNYQAVIRNSDGSLMKNRFIEARFTIFNNEGNVFTETYSLNTNEYGLINVVVGENSDDYKNINWAATPYSLHVEINKGSGFEDMGSSVIQAVPYSNLALDVVNKEDADADPANELQTLSVSGDQLTISSGNTVTLPSSSTGDQWGSQVVESDNSLSGDGTITNPLSVDRSIIVFERNGTTIHQISSYDTDDFILGREALPVNGENVTGKMLFFDKSKGAFRAGNLNKSDIWSPKNIGSYSFAVGYNTKASGSYSTAMGLSTIANGNYSSAMGRYSTANGDYSTALGYNTTASGKISIAMGYSTTAPSYNETVLGRYNTKYTPNSTDAWDDNDRL